MIKAAATILSVLLLGGCAPEPREDAVQPESPSSSPHTAGATDHLPGVRPADSRSVTYTSDGGRSLQMDVIAPTAKADIHRGILLIHGGGWVGGNRGQMNPIADSLADKGFTCFTVEYTLASPGHRWPMQLQDVQAATRYVRSHAKEFHIAPEHLAAAGVSAGGHLSMWLGVKDAPVNRVSSRVQAVGSISGVLDLNLPLTPAGEPYRIVQQLLVNAGEPTKDQKQQASPVSLLNKHSAPVFFIQGTADPLVPANQSKEAEAKMKSLGLGTDLILVDGMGHGLEPSKPEEAKALDRLAQWLKEELQVKA